MPMAPSPFHQSTTPEPASGTPGPLRQLLGALILVAGVGAYLLHHDLAAAGTHFLVGSAVLGVPLALPWGRSPGGS